MLSSEALRGASPSPAHLPGVLTLPRVPDHMSPSHPRTHFLPPLPSQTSIPLCPRFPLLSSPGILFSDPDPHFSPLPPFLPISVSRSLTSPIPLFSQYLFYLQGLSFWGEAPTPTEGRGALLEVPRDLLSEALCFALSLLPHVSLRQAVSGLPAFAHNINNHSSHLLSMHYLLGAAKLFIPLNPHNVRVEGDHPHGVAEETEAPAGNSSAPV